MKKKLEYIFNFIFAIIILYLLYNMYNQSVFNISNNLYVFILSTIYIMFLFIITKFIKKLNLKKIHFIFLFAIIFILQLIAAHLFKVIPSWDVGNVYNESLNFTNTLINTEYFCRWPNNIPIMYLLKLIFIIFNFFNYYKFINVGIGINILFIDFSIFITILTIKKIFGKENAFLCLIMFFLMPTTYLLTPIFYTDTFTMPFSILEIYIYLILKKQTRNKNKIMYSILLGVITFIGINLKITTLISYIAIILYEFILFKNEKIKESLYLLIGTICLCFLILTEYFLFYNFCEYKEKIYNERFGAIHYVMMSATPIGSFCGEDTKYTTSFKTRAEKDEADLKKLKERLQNYDTPQKMLELITSKQVRLWNSGTFNLVWMLEKDHCYNGKFQNLIYKDNVIFTYICQIQRISFMILMIISSFYKKNEKWKSDYANMIFRISILGYIIFFSFWEISARYLINYIPIFISIQIFGLETLHSILNNIIFKLNEFKKNISKRGCKN